MEEIAVSAGRRTARENLCIMISAEFVIVCIERPLSRVYMRDIYVSYKQIESTFLERRSNIDDVKMVGINEI